MAKIQKIFCFLVHPRKSEGEQEPGEGTTVPLSGQPFTMLREIFDGADDECQTEISFSPAPDGTQQNDCRDLILAFTRSPTERRARPIAARLERITTLRSGLGLLFLLVGKEGDRSRVLLSRFPANQGIIAEESRNGLSIEFIEKVFMKTAKAYKAALYFDRADSSGFWDGRAVDKQINGPDQHLANYWIREFLLSELKTTPAAGTKRLAVALREAIRLAHDNEVKAEIGAAATLASGQAGRTTSIAKFCSTLALSQAATAAVMRAVRDDRILVESFRFDAEEFGRWITFRSIALDNGAVVTAHADQFERVFSQETIDGDDGRVKISTTGRVVDQRLKRRLT